ncbi:MAG: PAS domain-containing sensor histidine kinase, partial [Bacteroidota bacterium]
MDDRGQIVQAPAASPAGGSLPNFSMFDEAPMEVVVYDPDGKYLYLNARAVPDQGIRRQLVGQTDLDYCSHLGLDGGLARSRATRLAEALDSNTSVSFSETITFPWGLTRQIDRTMQPVQGPNGSVKHVMSFGVAQPEISAGHAAEPAAEESGDASFEWLQLVLHHMPSGGVYAFGPDLTLLFAGGSELNTFGIDIIQAAGKPLAQALPEELVVQIEPGIRSALVHDHSTFEIKHEGLILSGTVIVLRDEHDAPGAILAYTRDVTEHRHSEVALHEARKNAEKAARLKASLLADMSHEIRTPLTTILGFASMLSEEAEGPQQEFADLIYQSGSRLMETLNSVLELARLEAESTSIDLEDVDVTQHVASEVLILKPQAEQKGLDLEIEVPTYPLIARLDRPCLSRILHNVVGNAIKYTESGKVTVRVEYEGRQLGIRVVDTGIGMAKSFQNSLFDEFAQEDPAFG